MRPALGEVLRTLGEAPGGGVAVHACNIIGINNFNGTVTLTCSSSQAGVSNQAYYQPDGAIVDVAGFTRAGNGTLLVPHTGELTSDIWYTFWVVSSIGTSISPPSNIIRIEMVKPLTDEVGSRAAEYAILAATRGNRCQWYRRKRGAGYPLDALNVDYTPTGTDIYAQTPVQLVTDQPDLWVQLGEVPVLLVELTPVALLRRAYGEELCGTHEGSCALRYRILPGDHLIDGLGREFRTITSDRPVNPVRMFRHLQLELLPRKALGGLDDSIRY